MAVGLREPGKPSEIIQELIRPIRGIVPPQAGFVESVAALLPHGGLPETLAKRSHSRMTVKINVIIP